MDEREILSIRIVKPHNRVEIRTADDALLVLPRRVYRQRKLREGDALPPEYATWAQEAQRDACWDTSLYYLSGRMRSSGQMRDYLQNKGYHAEAMDAAMEKLEGYGYVDDALFTEISLRSADKGKRQLRQSLLHKGVAAEIVESALEEISEESQREAAAKHARKALGRAKPGEDPRKTKKRMADALARRGFDWDIISSVIQEIEAEFE